MKPQVPSCEGKQYDENKEYIQVHFDENDNVIPADPSMHTDATPGMGSFNFSGGQYHDEFSGGYGSEVSAPSGSKSIDVEAGTTKRGDE